MIQIREIYKKKDIKKFVEFPNILYKDCPYFVPNMFGDEVNMFNPKKNPAYEYCETKLFLAYKNNKIVGTICGLISHAYNLKKDVKQIRFTRIDMIDDIEVTKALVNAVMEWGIEKGMNQMIGPIGFSDFDKQGLLVEGYDEMSNSLTLYHYPYYKEHLEKLGFIKDIDWIEFQVMMPKKEDERLNRLSDAIQKRYGYHMIKVKSKREVKPYIKLVFDLINEAFAPLYGVVKLTDNQKKDYTKQFIQLVNYNFLFLVADKNNDLVGFGLIAPSINDALRSCNGHLFPFGFLKLLKDLKKTDIMDMYLIAVKPEHQSKGVNGLILAEGVRTSVKYGVRYAETGPELETNTKVISQWKGFEVRQHRRRRCFTIDL
ncbi:MAG: hypothetical protein RBR27_02415 [Bacilli bacterium]|jgi:hypothetical protein|nr:hypothetical protein [Bacilli bacterium]